MASTMADMTAVILEHNWTLENGFITVKHDGQKMIFNDSLTMVWLEIDGVSTADEIARRICEKAGGEDPDEAASVVITGLQLLAEEELIALKSTCADGWFGEEAYAGL